MRARARFNDNLDPRVVVGEHGWWQACPELGAPGYDPFAADGANFNLLIGTAARRPGQRHRLAPLLPLRNPAGLSKTAAGSRAVLRPSRRGPIYRGRSAECSSAW